MKIPSTNLQAAVLGLGGAACALYGSTATGVSDRSRISGAGIAAMYATASAFGGFKVWAAIGAGAAAGTAAPLGAELLRSHTR